MKHFISTLAVLLVCAILPACIDDSDADSSSGPTTAEVQQMIEDATAPLIERIDALEGRSPNVLAASGSATATGFQKTGAIGDICTVLDYTPNATFPGKMNSASCKSINGFLLTMPITSSTATVRPSMLDDERLYFTDGGCAGEGYVHPTQIGDMGLTQGAVFGTPANATAYTPPNPEIIQELPTASVMEIDSNGDSVCNPVGPGLTGVQVISNDPSVTGIENTYDGPVSMF